MVALGVADIGAQSTPPRPAVSVRQQQPFFFSTFAADLNEDGRPDLIGATRAQDLRDRIGMGDGTFGPSRSLNRQGSPLAVGDFNGDRHRDLVVLNGRQPLHLPGRGDGTFASPRIVGPWDNAPSFNARIVVADFNGDGKQDFALIDLSVVCVYPGRGDFTFDTRVELTAPEFPSALVAADFNGDGTWIPRQRRGQSECRASTSS